MGVIRGSSYYAIVDGPSWTAAESNAVGMGGHLASINNREEDVYLEAVFGTREYFYQTNTPGWDIWDINFFWIGLSDSNREGDWRWSSGEPVSYTNWGAAMPNNNGPAFPSHDYTILGYVLSGRQPLPASGYWDDLTNTGQEAGWNVTNQAYRGIAEIPLSYFSISDLTLEEGESGRVTISRTGGTESSQTLILSSSDGTAVVGDDYTRKNQTISFAAGETSKTVSVGTIDDSAVESSETFNLTLTASSSDAVPAQISDGTAVVTINDNDANNGNIVVTGDGNTVGNTTVINNTTNNTDNSTTTNVTINNSSTSNNTTNNTNNITNNFSNVVGNITVDLSSLIQGVSSKSDAISGSAKDDALGAGKGADKLTGAGGADQFVFNTKDKFGKKGADTITDFNPEEEDQLVLSPDALPGLKTDPTLQSVTSKKALKAAQKSDSDLVYYQPLGQLFYDQNSTRKGFGKGGLFAVLLGAPAITAEDLAIF